MRSLFIVLGIAMLSACGKPVPPAGGGPLPPPADAAPAAGPIPDQRGDSPPPTKGKPVAAVGIAWVATATDVPGTFDLALTFSAQSRFDELTVGVRAEDAALTGIAASNVFTSVDAGANQVLAGRLVLSAEVCTVQLHVTGRSTDVRSRVLAIRLTRSGQPAPREASEVSAPVTTGPDGEQLILMPSQEP